MAAVRAAMRVAFLRFLMVIMTCPPVIERPRWGRLTEGFGAWGAAGWPIAELSFGVGTGPGSSTYARPSDALQFRAARRSDLSHPTGVQLR
jgi:hypothetical protein